MLCHDHPCFSVRPETTENWDDDFEFHPNNGDHHDKGKPASRTLTTGQRNEDWDDEHAAPTNSSPPPLTRDKKNLITKHPSLQHWAEPGPSTPTRKSTSQTENWDDDFQEKSDSPNHQHALGSSPRSRRARVRLTAPEPENWDDDFEAGSKVGSPSGKSARWEESSSSDEEFGPGDREEDRTVTSRSRRSVLSAQHLGDTPPPPVPPIPSVHLGPLQDPAPFPRSPTASVFSVPLSSAGGRESVAYSYNSTAPLALRPTTSGSSFGVLPPSPPIHRERERRRLRKKSKPPRVDDNIYELEDRNPEASIPLNVRPCTPERAASPQAGNPSDSSLPREFASPSSVGRSSLVSRIGSVGKKWGVARKKRASTGPNEIALQEHQEGIQTTPRPPTAATSTATAAAAASSPHSASSSSKTNWFFRHGGGAGSGSGSPPSQALTLKHEKSVDKIPSMVDADPDSPSKGKRKLRHRDHRGLSSERNGEVKHEEPHVPSRGLLFGTPRRPTSMAIPSTSSQGIVLRARVPRHASYGQQRPHTPSSRSSSKPRSVSASAEDVESHDSHSRSNRGHRDDPQAHHELPPEHHGHRGFMGGMRRISQASKPKRSQSRTRGSSEHDQHDRSLPSTSTSTTAVPHRLIPDRSDDATPRPPSRVTRPSMDICSHVDDEDLLPPIELQPPSPPRHRAPAALSSSFSAPTPMVAITDSLLSPRSSADQLNSSIPHGSPIPLNRPKVSSSPQHSASLGRSVQPPKMEEVNGSAFVPRRNSLGDLKIPARISQAQVGLKRDLTLVRDFASSVERESFI